MISSLLLDYLEVLKEDWALFVPMNDGCFFFFLVRNKPHLKYYGILVLVDDIFGSNYLGQIPKFHDVIIHDFFEV